MSRKRRVVNPHNPLIYKTYYPNSVWFTSVEEAISYSKSKRGNQQIDIKPSGI